MALATLWQELMPPHILLYLFIFVTLPQSGTQGARVPVSKWGCNCDFNCNCNCNNESKNNLLCVAYVVVAVVVVVVVGFIHRKSTLVERVLSCSLLFLMYR